MYLRARELLTPDQRKDFLTIPSTLSNWELAYYYTLTQSDIEVIKRRRRDHNRLGFAIQICLFRYPGWSLSDIKNIPDKVINYVAKQLQVDPIEFKQYSEREQTKHEHMEEIRKHYGFSNFFCPIISGYFTGITTPCNRKFKCPVPNKDDFRRNAKAKNHLACYDND